PTLVILLGGAYTVNTSGISKIIIKAQGESTLTPLNDAPDSGLSLCRKVFGCLRYRLLPGFYNVRKDVISHAFILASLSQRKHYPPFRQPPKGHHFILSPVIPHLAKGVEDSVVAEVFWEDSDRLYDYVIFNSVKHLLPH